MRIERLDLQDFRNYELQSIAFTGGLNLIKGRNAQGKTNLLEAVHCLSGLGSPRAADTALVRDGADRAILHGELVRSERSLRIDMEVRPGKGTRILVNRTPVPRASAVGRMAVTVFFGPDELSLVKGSPEGRRRFLDEIAVKLRPARDAIRRDWDRVLRQRNALLKSAPRGQLTTSTRQTLEVWDDSLSRTGAAVTAARLESLAGLRPLAAKRYEEVAGGGRLEISYGSAWLEDGLATELLTSPSTIDEARLRAVLSEKVAEVRSQELERGISLVGPHRDDVVVTLAAGGGSMLDARTFASQGDQRTSALAMKLAEHDLLTEALGEEPILLLDDVFSELDPSRRGWLQDAVRHMSQTLVSSAEASAADEASAKQVLEIVAGRVDEVGS